MSEATVSPATAAAALADVALQRGELNLAFREMAAVPTELSGRYGSMAKRLDLSCNSLASLDSLAGFTVLKELILDGNKLSDGMALPQPLPSLETLSLNKNQLTDVESLLEHLKAHAPNLRFLSLLGNGACPNELVSKEEEDYVRYRYLVLFHLPHLKFLDSTPVHPKEVAEAARLGGFMKVVRLDPDQMDAEASRNAPQYESGFSPLPQDERPPDAHKGTISTCKYVYFGRHSEGNRFIRNSDL